MPTTFADSKVQISERVARSRREETYNAALEIHAWLIRCLSVIIPFNGKITNVILPFYSKITMSICYFQDRVRI